MYLIGMALFGTSNTYQHLNKDEITLHLLIAKCVKTLTRIQRVDFAFIIHMLHKRNEKNVANEENMTHTTTSSFESGISSDAVLSTKSRYQMPLYVICIFTGNIALLKIFHILQYKCQTIIICLHVSVFFISLLEENDL